MPPICKPDIESATVRVMRSYDYCHFEVVLTVRAQEDLTRSRGPSGPSESTSRPVTLTIVDQLRKEAARLVDKAVDQFRKKKHAIEVTENWETAHLRKLAQEAGAEAEADRTPEEMATIKAYQDRLFEARYDYEDN